MPTSLYEPKFNKQFLVALLVSMLLLNFVFLVSIPFKAIASPNGGQGGRGPGPQMEDVSLEKIMASLTIKLQLNQGQVAEVRPIMKNYLNKSQELKQETKGDDQSFEGPNGNRTRIESLRQETVDQVSVFLNDDQYGQFMELVESLTQKGKQNNSSEGRPSGGGGRGK